MTPEQTKEAIDLAEEISKLPDHQVALATIEGVQVHKITDLLNQPIEGLLYDLNRDRCTNYARLRSGDLRAVNDIATAKIIEYLISKQNDTTTIR